MPNYIESLLHRISTHSSGGRVTNHANDGVDPATSVPPERLGCFMASPVSDLLDQIKIIDTDTHIIEPYDLWTSRVSTQRWGNMVPHVEWSEAEQQDVWIF